MLRRFYYEIHSPKKKLAALLLASTQLGIEYAMLLVQLDEKSLKSFRSHKRWSSILGIANSLPLSESKYGKLCGFKHVEKERSTGVKDKDHNTSSSNVLKYNVGL